MGNIKKISGHKDLETFEASSGDFLFSLDNQRPLRTFVYTQLSRE